MERVREEEEKDGHLHKVESLSAKMPRHCSAGGCKSRDNRETRCAGITFHKLPKGATRRTLWITNSHRTDLWDPQTDFVYFCSKHFTSDSFELTGYSGIRRLREDAFPTVFETAPEPKRKGPGRPRKGQGNQIRKKSCPAKVEANQERTQEANVESENKDVEEAQSSVPTNGEKPDPAEETDTNVLPSLQGTSEPVMGPSENPPQQECLESPLAPPQSPPSPRPHSPSRYMRRLPPPPGFYLPKEHSYAQLCPLVWRRRCDRAIDCLEKALRQLSAARRRENRLRNALLRLREKRFKHTLLLSRDGSKSRGGQPEGVENGQCRGRGSSLASQEESEMDVETEVMGLFEDRLREPMDWGGWVPSTDSRTGSEEEGGYCFYCGRGREDDGGGVAGSISKTWKDGQAAARGGLLRSRVNERGGECDKRLQVPKRFQGKKKATPPPASEAQASQGSHENRHYSYGMGKGAAEDVRVVMLERLPGKGTEATLNLHGSSQLPVPQALLPSHTQVDLQLQGTTTGGPPHNTHIQYLQPGLSPQQGLLLSDLYSSGEAELVGSQQQEELLHQVFWIQESAEGQLLLIPVDDGQKNVVGMEGVAEDAQTILVSEVDFLRDFGQVAVDSKGPCLENMSRGLRVLMATDDGQGGQQSNLKSTTVVMREDVREKLKEHLEGFQLQLSNEFID